METKYYKNGFKGSKLQKRYNRKLNTINKNSHLPLQMMLSITSRRTDINIKKNNNSKSNNHKTTIQNKNNREKMNPEIMHSFEILSGTSSSTNDLDITFDGKYDESPIKFSFNGIDILNNLKDDYSPEIDYCKAQDKHKYLPKIQPFIRTFQPKKHLQKNEHESIIKNNENNETYLGKNTETFSFTPNKSLNNFTSQLFSENNNEGDLMNFSNQSTCFSFMFDN